MIRLIQRRLIIPRGDTGSFSIPTIGAISQNDIAIFGIFDPLTHKTVVMKKITATEPFLTFTFKSEDTINLEPRKYNWDVTIYKSPQYDEDDELIGAAEVTSYYSAFKLPICEITEVALDMNKERWRTRDLLLEENKYQAANSIQTVYPWEQLQRSQLEQQLYGIAVDSGFEGTFAEFAIKFLANYINGNIVIGTIDTFPENGNKKDIYLDTNTNSLYSFKVTTENITVEDFEALGNKVIKQETQDSLTYTYYYSPIQNLIKEVGDINDNDGKNG